MAVTKEWITPKVQANSKVGTSSKPWEEINALSIKQNGQALATLASPAFTGNPTAPTQTAADNSTKLATTAYADTAAAARASATHASGHIQGAADEIDGDQVDVDVTLSNITPDTGPAEVSDNAHLGAIIVGIDNALATKASTTHASDHIRGASDELDGDQVDIDVTLTNITPDITPAEVSHVAHLGAIIAGIDNALGSYSSATHQARHIRGGADELDGDQLDIDLTLVNITADTSPAEVSNAAHLSSILKGIDNALDFDVATIDVTLANITPDTTPVEVSSVTDLGAIIKGIDNALGSGAVTAHASSHVRGASDEIDGDQVDIDVTLANITPDTAPTEVSNAAHLGAIIVGIDNALGSVASSTHASSHIRGAADEIDGDQLDLDLTLSNITPDTSPGEVSNAAHLGAIIKGIDNALDFDVATIDVTLSNITPDTTPAEVSAVTDLGAIIKGIDNALASAISTTEDIQDAIGAAIADSDTITPTYNDVGNQFTWDIIKKPTGDLLGGSQGEIGSDSDGAYVRLGTTNKTAGRGDFTPTTDEKDAMTNVTGTASATNPFILAKLDDLTLVEPAMTDSAALYDASGAALGRTRFQDLFWNRHDFTGKYGGGAADLDGETTDEKTLTRQISFTDSDGCTVERTYQLTNEASPDYTVTANSGTDEINTTVANNLRTGDIVRFLTTGTLPGGLSLNTDYTVLNVGTADGLATDNDIEVTSNGTTPVDILDTGTGTHTMFRNLAPFQVRPGDYNVSTNQRTWILQSEGLDHLSYEAYAPTESLTVADSLVAYAEKDFEVCQVGFNLMVAPAGSGSGTVTVNVLVNGVDFLTADVDITAIGQTLSSLVDDTAFERGIIRQGDLIELSVTDVGGVTAAQGMRLFFLGKGE